MSILSFPDALTTVLTHAENLRPDAALEEVGLQDALGRVLARPLHADLDQPPFDRSTRDGYAVRAEDLNHPLRLIGSIRAGEAWQGPDLATGQALEIMTGAPVPSGANAVLMLEHATLEGDTLHAEAGRTLKPGENIVPRAAEASAGSQLLPAGSRLGAAEISVAASCGATKLPVFAKPGVSIVATGDELVDVNQTPAPHQIRNSNSHSLAALVTAEGGAPWRLPIARDTVEDLRARLVTAMTTDLILFSGGVSAGKFDLVEQVLAEANAEFLFTGALIQPGKPIVFGRIPRLLKQQTSAEEGSTEASGEEPLKGPGFSPAINSAEKIGALAPEGMQGSSEDYTYFFGLPGNPISTQVCFHLFVAPLLRSLAGRTDLAPSFAEARLSADVKGGAKVTRFLPAELSSAWDGVTVTVLNWQGSGDIATNARANGYAVLPTDIEQFRAGETVRVLLR